MSFNTPSTKQRIVAVGLLTKENLRTLRPTFNRAWPVDDILLRWLLETVDEADRANWRERDDTDLDRP